MRKLIIAIAISNLAHDLCDGFEDTYKYDKMAEVLTDIVAGGEYTIDQLCKMNNEDSTLVYDIVSNYYKR